MTTSKIYIFLFNHEILFYTACFLDDKIGHNRNSSDIPFIHNFYNLSYSNYLLGFIFD